MNLIKIAIKVADMYKELHAPVYKGNRMGPAWDSLSSHEKHALIQVMKSNIGRRFISHSLPVSRLSTILGKFGVDIPEAKLKQVFKEFKELHRPY